jgi:hypothetical protein
MASYPRYASRKHKFTGNFDCHIVVIEQMERNLSEANVVECRRCNATTPLFLLVLYNDQKNAKNLAGGLG